MFTSFQAQKQTKQLKPGLFCETKFLVFSWGRLLNASIDIYTNIGHRSEVKKFIYKRKLKSLK